MGHILAALSAMNHSAAKSFIVVLVSDASTRGEMRYSIVAVVDESKRDEMRYSIVAVVHARSVTR